MLDKLKNEGCYMSYLRNINVRWGCFDLTDVLKMRFKDDEVERYMIEKGDLVFCEGGEPGRCAIWDKANPIMFQKALHRIRCHGGVLNEYLKYVIEDYAKANKLEEYYTGSTIKHLTGESLVSILFPLPPIKEQERIVQEIQRYLSLVAIIENNKENLLAAIKQAKSKVLDLAIHGKLVPQDPNDEPASELLKRINPKAEITCDTPQYGKLPKGWCETTLKSLAKEVFAGGDKPTEFTKEKTNGNIIPIYANGVEKDGLYGYTNAARVIEPCLTVSARGTIGFTCIRNIPFVPIVRLITIVPNPAFDLKYMKFCLDCLLIWSEGSSIPQLTVPTIKKMQLPLPPLQEQHRIVAKIEELFTQFDKIEEGVS